MSDRHRAEAKAKRLEVFESYRETFASAPIRLMSRTVSTMQSLGYDDLASAIGDLDWRLVPRTMRVSMLAVLFLSALQAPL